ncbi:MAG: hypothetical protein AAB903_01980 [Patescibacteria group bacterium]
MMKLLKKYHVTPINVLKVGGLILAGLVAAVFIFSLIGSSFGSIAERSGMRNSAVFSTNPSGMGVSYEEADSYKMFDAPELSVRNVTTPMPPQIGGTTGSDAEAFEVTDYSATIETYNKEKTCAVFTDLKKLEYVIFENANQSDRGCNYTFKVQHSRAAEVLEVVKGLDPEDISENIYTIKQQISDFTSQTEVLEKKRASIDETLAKALDAYDEITVIATKAQNPESLAKIIDSKIQIIERLTRERISINEQLDWLSRAKLDQLDRLLYTRFYIGVYENRYIDLENLKDSWQIAIRNFFWTINQALQNATINLIAVLFIAVPYIIYLFILLIVAKYGWRIAKQIWKK